MLPSVRRCRLTALLFLLLFYPLCSLLAQTSVYANGKTQADLRKAVVISIHHLLKSLVTASINAIEQKMPRALWKNLSTAFQREVYFQLVSLALDPVIYKTTEPSGVNYI